MKKAAFLEMQPSDQEVIVLEEFPDFEMRAYDNTCFGIFYDVPDDEIEEYLTYAEDYGTFDAIKSVLSEFSEKRSEEIADGSPLLTSELLALKKYISEQNAEAWTGLHGWTKACDDGDVFLVFWGQSQGQGGIQLEYYRAFESEKQARKWVENFEIYSFM